MNLKNKKIYFRFDAGGVIGFGHMGRVEAISDTCKSMGFEPVWIIRKRPSLKILESKYQVIWLDENPDAIDPDPETWKSISEKKEAEDFLSAVPDAEIVFIDHYSLYFEFIQLLKKKNIKTICIFDFIPENFSCDYAINYNIGADKELEKFRSINSSCHYYLGAQFAPIKTTLSHHNSKIHNSKKLENFGIYLGGVSNTLNLKLLKILEGFDFIQNRNISWCISSEADLNAMKLVKTKLNIEFIGRQGTLLEFYNWSDVIIGASGVSFLERSFIGIPQVLFKVAENQKNVIKYLPDEHLALYVGDLVSESIDDLSKKLNEFDAEKIFEYALNAFEKYDGNGQKRFLENILDKIKCG